VQPVAELEIFGTQGSNFRCVLAGTCTLRYASSWHDTGISPNSIRTRIGWLQHCSRDSGQDPDFGHYHSDHPQALALPLNSQARA